MTTPDTIKSDKVIWGLLGKNRGDSSQVEVLCQALGKEFGVEPVFKKLTCIKRFVVPNIFRRPSLNILSKADKQKLAPEWPDIIVGSGRKTVAVARWVKQQSGNKTKLVWIGRPKAPLEWFDLAITTPQYGLPEGPNIYQLPLPLVPHKTVVSALHRWQDLPRPWIGVLVGGARFPVQMDDHCIGQLGHCITAACEASGGTALVSTSPRTGRETGEKLQSLVPSGSDFYLWQKDGENPYQAILSNADRFIVTGDSASMMGEACHMGKPVEVFPLQRSSLWPRWGASNGFIAWLIAKGVLAPPRDISAIHDLLLERGLADVYGRKNRNGQVEEGCYNQDTELSVIVARVGKFMS